MCVCVCVACMCVCTEGCMCACVLCLVSTCLCVCMCVCMYVHMRACVCVWDANDQRFYVFLLTTQCVYTVKSDKRIINYTKKGCRLGLPLTKKYYNTWIVSNMLLCNYRYIFCLFLFSQTNTNEHNQQLYPGVPATCLLCTLLWQLSGEETHEYGIMFGLDFIFIT